MKKLLLFIFSLLIFASCSTSTIDAPTGFLGVPFGSSQENAIRIMERQGFFNHTNEAIEQRTSFIVMLGQDFLGYPIVGVYMVRDDQTDEINGFMIPFEDFRYYTNIVSYISDIYGEVTPNADGEYYWSFGNTGVSISIYKGSNGGFVLHYDKSWVQG